MDRRISLLGVCVLVLAGFLTGELLDIYRQGAIKVIPSAGFGQGTDWGSFFYKDDAELAVAPGGAIFVSFKSQHSVVKFSPPGKVVSRFGRKGLGPGDLYFPGNLSILDGKFLVIGEYPEYRTISLFDFTGKYVRKLKTRYPVFSPVALKNDKVAYLGISSLDKDKSMVRIVIKDTLTGDEKIVETVKIVDKSSFFIKGGFLIKFDNCIGEVFINRTGKGELLVGVSDKPDIKIYSEKGESLRSFKLQLSPLPVTSAYIDKYKENFVKGSSYLANELNSVGFEQFFGKHLPYYREILVDEEGNILVFKWPDCVAGCEPVFQVYSAEEKYVCESGLNLGLFEMNIDRRFKKLAFMRDGIFGLFGVKGSEDISIKIVKVNLTHLSAFSHSNLL